MKRRRSQSTPRDKLGGVIHTYQAYDPKSFPPPTKPPPDMVSSAFDHLLMFGSTRNLTEEELARAVHIDPSQIRGFGPSIDALIAMLEERKRKILATYETETVQNDAAAAYRDLARKMDPPADLAAAFAREVADEQVRDLEALWYRVDERSPFARDLLHLVERLAEHKVLVLPGTTCESPGHFRISLTGTPAMIERSLPVLRAANA